MPARFIVLEGIDQSGKKTQTRLLVRELRRQGFKTSALSFPIYGTPSGREIRAFLEGKRRYPSEVVHMLYSLNRWENRDAIIHKLNESELLVADRYTGSNLAYGLARGLDLNWLVALDKGLPVPDAVILLDVPVPSSFHRKTANRDVHERNRDLLSRVRRSYLRLARKFHWKVVKGSGPAQTVRMDVWNAIQSLVSGEKPRKMQNVRQKPENREKTVFHK